MTPLGAFQLYVLIGVFVAFLMFIGVIITNVLDEIRTPFWLIVLITILLWPLCLFIMFRKD